MASKSPKFGPSGLNVTCETIVTGFGDPAAAGATTARTVTTAAIRAIALRVR